MPECFGFLLYLWEVHAFGRPAVFAGFAAICWLGAAWLYLALPETAGKSLEEIADLFRRPGDDVYAPASSSSSSSSGNSGSKSGNGSGGGSGEGSRGGGSGARRRASKDDGDAGSSGYGGSGYGGGGYGGGSYGGGGYVVFGPHVGGAALAAGDQSGDEPLIPDSTTRSSSSSTPPESLSY
jgi:hypothetical protein